METLFRDIFIYVVDNKSGYDEWVIDTYNLKIKGESEISKSYLLAEIFNFQNLNDINSAFSLLIGEDVLDEIGNMVIYIFDKEEIKKLALNKSIPKWKADLEEALNTRHNIVHDSSYLLTQETINIEDFQDVVLYFSQIFSIYIMRYFKIPYGTMTRSGSDTALTAFFRKEDFEGQWYVKT